MTHLPQAAGHRVGRIADQDDSWPVQPAALHDPREAAGRPRRCLRLDRPDPAAGHGWVRSGQRVLQRAGLPARLICHRACDHPVLPLVGHYARRCHHWCGGLAAACAAAAAAAAALAVNIQVPPRKVGRQARHLAPSLLAAQKERLVAPLRIHESLCLEVGKRRLHEAPQAAAGTIGAHEEVVLDSLWFRPPLLLLLLPVAIASSC